MHHAGCDVTMLHDFMCCCILPETKLVCTIAHGRGNGNARIEHATIARQRYIRTICARLRPVGYVTWVEAVLACKTQYILLRVMNGDVKHRCAFRQIMRNSRC